MSLLTFAFYAKDKSASIKKKRRTPENTLHLLSLCGGWIGAIMAQQIFRHKTKKVSFRIVFWITVITNCVILFSILYWFLKPSFFYLKPSVKNIDNRLTRNPSLIISPRSVKTEIF